MRPHMPVASFLRLTGVVVTGATMGTDFDLGWMVHSVAGPNLTLDEDTKTIKIAEDSPDGGLYAVYMKVAADGAFNQYQFTLPGKAVGGGEVLTGLANVYETSDPTVSASTGNLIMPAVPLANGDSFKAHAYYDNADSSGTFSIESNATVLYIVRLGGQGA